jgi:hypothetical protein
VAAFFDLRVGAVLAIPLFGQMPFQGLVESVRRLDLFQLRRQLDLIGLLACPSNESGGGLAFLGALANRA